jgi:hypothetical protein
VQDIFGSAGHCVRAADQTQNVRRPSFGQTFGRKCKTTTQRQRLLMTVGRLLLVASSDNLRLANAGPNEQSKIKQEMTPTERGRFSVQDHARNDEATALNGWEICSRSRRNKQNKHWQAYEERGLDHDQADD